MLHAFSIRASVILKSHVTTHGQEHATQTQGQYQGLDYKAPQAGALTTLLYVIILRHVGVRSAVLVAHLKKAPFQSFVISWKRTQSMPR